MKKLFLTFVAAIISLSASAQGYVGGEVGFWRNFSDNKTTFSVAPEVGYNLSDTWAMGVTFQYVHAYEKGVKINAVTFDPYARFTYAKLGPVNLFLDGGFGIAVYKEKDADDSNVGWNVGIKPGVAVNLTDKLSFVAHIGFLGYRDSNDDHPWAYYGDDGFGFDISGNDLTFGLYYNF